MRIYSDHEAKRYDFYEYADFLSMVEGQLGLSPPDHLRGASRAEKYAHFLSKKRHSSAKNQADLQDDLHVFKNLEMDAQWDSIGSPYYKIWPAIGKALAETQMDMPAELIRLPHPCFAIRLPKEDNPCPMFAAGMVLTSTKPQDQLPGCTTFILSVQQKDRQSFRRFVPLFFRHGESIEANLLNRLTSYAARNEFNSSRDWEEVCSCTLNFFRIAIGVCFFGANRHEMVMPDMTRKIIDRFQRLQREPTEQEFQQALEQSKRAGLGGYKVGSEIDLPSPLVRYHGNRSEETGRELTQGHVRRGHMRMQPVGPGRQQRKLVFVHPCLVRPDLPMGHARGYRIRESVN